MQKFTVETTPFSAAMARALAKRTASVAFICAMGWVGPTMAQSATAATDEQSVGEVVVTGSRIARPETDAPSPVVTFSAQAIQESGKTNVIDFLSESPALVRSSVGGDGAGGVTQNLGLATLNLRGLGANRTLVLLNGRRHVGAVAGTGTVDVNTIPTDLIERVDIVTGGASAVYGSDAVSGVVNFVMKRNFEGLTVRGQLGTSSQNDAQNRFGAITAGRNFADDRANVAVSYEFNQNARLLKTSRNRSKPLNYIRFVRNPNDIPDDPTIPDYIPTDQVRSPNTGLEGAFDLGSLDSNGVFVPGAFDGVAEFTGSGKVYDEGVVLPDSGGLSIGGDGVPYDIYFGGELRTPLTRHAVNVLSHYDFTSAVRFFAEAQFVRNSASSIGYPTYDIGTFIAGDNPFLPDSIKALAANGIVDTERDNADLGLSENQSRQDTLQGVLGVEGDLTDWLSYSTSYVYGQTERTQHSADRLTDRYFAAIDATVDPDTGQPVCRSNLDPAAVNPYGNYSDGPRMTFTPGANSGCVAYNIFGYGVASQEAMDWVSTVSLTKSKLTQQVANLAFTGNFDQLLKLSAGSIGFAAGLEWRKETSDFNPDQDQQDGVVFFGGPQPRSGSYNVKEAFAELRAPLLKDLPLVHSLTVGLAGRRSDYSTAGGSTAWNEDLEYAPLHGITFRGSLSKAVRAPNIGELFRGSEFIDTFAGYRDPCDRDNINNGSAYRVANCTELLTSLGVDPAEFAPNARGILTPNRIVSSGNTDLDPETSKTWTVGIVLDQSRIRGLNASLDWYDVKISGAIGEPSFDTLFNLCVDVSTLDNPYCPLTVRDTSDGPTKGYLVTGQISPVNVASFRTSGQDFTLNYNLPLAELGTWNLHLVANHLRSLSLVDAPGADERETSRYEGSPRYSVNQDLTWQKGAWAVNYGVSWWSKTDRYSRESLLANPDKVEAKYLKIKARWIHDLNLSFDAGKNLNVYAGVNNLFDQKPDLARHSYPAGPLGRYFYTGASFRFR